MVRNALRLFCWPQSVRPEPVTFELLWLSWFSSVLGSGELRSPVRRDREACTRPFREYPTNISGGFALARVAIYTDCPLVILQPRTGSNANPLLVARDSTDGSLVTLQEFQTVHEHARVRLTFALPLLERLGQVRDCQRKCCLRANDAPNSPTSGLTSPMSSPIGEPMLCDILEIHGNVNTGGWLAVMGACVCLAHLRGCNHFE